MANCEGELKQKEGDVEGAQEPKKKKELRIACDGEVKKSRVDCAGVLKKKKGFLYQPRRFTLEGAYLSHYGGDRKLKYKLHIAHCQLVENSKV